MENETVINKNIIPFFLKVFLFLFIFMQPLYLWSSGYPQISDFIGVAIISIVFFEFKIKKINNVLGVSILFVVYIMFINLFWGLFLQEHIEAIRTSSWYIYNVLIFISCIYVINKINVISLIQIAVVGSIIIELIVVIFLPGAGLREVGTFNNPNQLGYFSLLYLSLFYIITNKQNQFKSTSNLLFWIVTFSSVFLALYSLSKATLISILFLVVIELFYYFKNNSLLKTLFVSSILIIIGVILTQFFDEKVTNSSLYLNLENRVLDIGKNSDDNASARGYDRIIKHPEYLLLGAGEISVTERFNSIRHEFHSTLGNLFFSYGILGLILFLYIVYWIIKNTKMQYSFVLLPLTLYSLTHNGIRNTILWVLFALIYVLGVKAKTKVIKGDLNNEKDKKSNYSSSRNGNEIFAGNESYAKRNASDC